ncbi:Transcription factor AZF1 [Cladobotryum mycophilum]|uniref:C2H2 type master regulator of conidiophore development brlA n=1 Tax=Cladobotryum mycophilum TaxID=491253 RepID=A0ABR0SMI3_9HYPO
MALTAQPQTHSNWGRWSQQLPQEFPMMENQGFLPYDSRAPASAHIQRPMPPQYVVEQPYQPAPIQTMPAPPQYQGQPGFSYMPYQSPPPSTPVGSPFKQEAPRMISETENSNSRLSTSYRRESKPANEYQPRSPDSRSGSVSSAASKPNIPSPIVNAKTITFNETLNPADQVNFETDVDELMKAIQQKKQQQKEDMAAAAAAGKIQQTLTPAQTPKSEPMEAQSPASTAGPSAPADGKPKKKWVCDGPSCNKSFVQKTHLDIHRRTHTGAKPYVCNKDNCGLTFSQRGNLKTHMRRHTGEKPYACSLCGKLFAQRGNVRSHEETHKGLKPFVCRLDDCNKTFSQLGNMKTHQNNFHKDTLQKLTSKFVQFLADGEVPDTYQELFEYFQEHYKNSNKGIKGRGKARTVAARKPKGGASAQSATSTPSTASTTPVATQFPHGAIPNQHPAMPSNERVGSYEMGHGPAPMEGVQRGHYSMYEHQQQQQQQQQQHHQPQQQQQQPPQHQAPPQGGMMYEDHSRQMGFAPRMY